MSFRCSLPGPLNGLPNGSFGVGPPTPDAANTLHPMVPCGTPPPPGGNPLPTDKTKPVAKLGGKRRQRLAKLAVTVTVNEDATVRTSGSVKVGRRKLALRKVKRSVRAGKKVNLRLRLSRRGKASALAALARGRKATASVRVTATDAAKNATQEEAHHQGPALTAASCRVRRLPAPAPLRLRLYVICRCRT